MSSREAQEEAQRLREPVLAVDDEDDDDECGVELSAITLQPSNAATLTNDTYITEANGDGSSMGSVTPMVGFSQSNSTKVMSTISFFYLQ